MVLIARKIEAVLGSGLPPPATPDPERFMQGGLGDSPGLLPLTARHAGKCQRYALILAARNASPSSPHTHVGHLSRVKGTELKRPTKLPPENYFWDLIYFRSRF